MELGLLIGIFIMLIYINFNLCRIFEKLSCSDNSNPRGEGRELGERTSPPRCSLSESKGGPT